MTDAKPIRLNKRNVTKALKDAVKKRGRDYVYGDHFPICEYVVDQQPACLVGEVLVSSFGIPADRLELCENAQGVLEHLSNYGVLSYTPAVVDMLMKAQHFQDARSPWGDALDAALDFGK